MTEKNVKETAAKMVTLLDCISRENQLILQTCENGELFKAGPPELEFDDSVQDDAISISDETVIQIKQSAKRQAEYIHKFVTLVGEFTRIHPPRYKENLDGEAMQALYSQGKSVREIARRMGCSPSTVSRRLSK